MKALAGTGVPVPAMYHLCLDTSIVGTEFFVMQCLDGRIFWDPKVPEVGGDNAQRAGIYDAMNKAIAALAIVKPEAVGLQDFGRPGNYYARQIKRWSEGYRVSETEKIPEMDFLMDWLPKNIPGGGRTRLRRARRLPPRQHDLPSDQAGNPRRRRLGAVDARPPLRRRLLSVHAVAPDRRSRDALARRHRPHDIRHSLGGRPTSPNSASARALPRSPTGVSTSPTICSGWPRSSRASTSAASTAMRPTATAP